MIITWSSSPKYIVRFEAQTERENYVHTPLLILQTTGEPTVADKNFLHTQAVASTTWTINHNLGKYCSVTVIDTEGRVCFGSVNYASINQIIITFSAALSGSAYCN